MQVEPKINGWDEEFSGFFTVMLSLSLLLTTLIWGQICCQRLWSYQTMCAGDPGSRWLGRCHKRFSADQGPICENFISHAQAKPGDFQEVILSESPTHCAMASMWPN